MFVYVCICLYMFIYVYICLYVFIYVYICLYMFVYVYICLYIMLYVTLTFVSDWLSANALCFCSAFILYMYTPSIPRTFIHHPTHSPIPPSTHPPIHPPSIHPSISRVHIARLTQQNLEYKSKHMCEGPDCSPFTCDLVAALNPGRGRAIGEAIGRMNL